MNLRKLNFNDFAWRVLLTFTMICPLYYNHMQVHGFKTMRMGHEQAFQLGITILFAVTFVENVWLAAFLLWSIFLYAYFNFPSIGGVYVQHLFLACILYQVTYHLVNRKRVIAIFKVVLALCGLNILFSFLQIFNSDPLFINLTTGKWNMDPVGIMGIKAVSGVFSAICIPIAMYFSPWLTLAILPALILSQCSSAVLATVVSVLFLAWQRSKQIFFYMLVPIVIMGGMYVANDSKANMMTDRGNLWKVAMQDALVHPITGIGLDSFRNIGQMKPFIYFKDTTNNQAVKMRYVVEENVWLPPTNYKTKKDDGTQITFDPWDNPHNEYVGIVYEFGIIGLLIFLALLWDITKRLYRDPLVITIFAVFLVYLVSSIGQFPFHLARTAHLSIILLACYYKLTDKGEDRCLLSR